MSEAAQKKRNPTYPFTFTTHDRLFTLHAWMGVVGGVLLHLICFTGAFALFREELGVWQDPHRGRPEITANGLAVVESHLRASYADADSWGFAVPEAGARSAHMHVTKGDVTTEHNIDVARARVSGAHSVLSDFLFEMHFLYPIPGGMYLTGVLGVFMLLALLTGLFIHVRDLPRHIARFRATKGARIGWNDAHKVLGTMGLPFQLVLAISGVVLCFGTPLGAVFAVSSYGGDEKETYDAFGYGSADTRTRADELATPLPMQTLLARTRAEIPGFQPDYIVVARPLDASSVVTVYGVVPDVLFGRGLVELDAQTGEALSVTSPANMRLPGRIGQVLFGLHFAHFGGFWLKVLFAFLAFTTCLTVISGNAIFLLRRLPDHMSRGTTFLLRMTMGGSAAVVFATAVIFLVNHLLPADLEARPTVEKLAFVLPLLLATLYAAVRADVRAAARHILGASAAAFVVAVLCDVGRLPAHVFESDVFFVNVSLLLLATASVFLVRRLRVS